MGSGTMDNKQRTLASCPSPVDASTRHEHIMDYREAALAAHPLPILGQNAGIVENGGFVQQDAAAVDVASERHLLGMEVLKA